MKPHGITLGLIGVAMLGASVAAFAGEKTDIGKREYDSNCLACHGTKGKGDGPMAAELKTPVADLTVLAKKNGGVFPVAKVYETIDGRQQIKAHGSREMPVWGMQYATKGAPMHDDYPYDAEAFVRGRILALIDYLYRLQAK